MTVKEYKDGRNFVIELGEISITRLRLSKTEYETLMKHFQHKQLSNTPSVDSLCSNVGQLRQAMHGLPDHMYVHIQQVNAEFDSSLLNSAQVEELTFRDGKLKAKDKCLVLSDE